MKLDGCITTHLKLVAVDKDLDQIESRDGFRTSVTERKSVHIDVQPRGRFHVDRNKRGFQKSHKLSATHCIPKADTLDPHDPGGKSEGEGDSSKEKRRQLIANIAASVEHFDRVPSDEGGWPASFDNHSAGAICENMDDDKNGGLPKRFR